jgi:long-chain fatty acid transport protein
VCFGAIGPVTCAGLGLTPRAVDGYAEIEGDDWSSGYNVGFAWTPTPNWTIGLTYRSTIDHELEGDGTFLVPAPAPPLTAGGAFTNTSGSAKLDLPAFAEPGAKWRATSQLAVYASAQWTEWSNLEKLRVEFANPAQPDSVEELSYKDSWRYSIGAEYRLDPQWMLRAGFAIDESPTQAEFRTARIPDNYRRIYALGAGWTPSSSPWSVDLAYNRVEVEDTDFDHTGISATA